MSPFPAQGLARFAVAVGFEDRVRDVVQDFDGKARLEVCPLPRMDGCREEERVPVQRQPGMVRLGGTHAAIAALMLAEVVIVLGAAAVLASIFIVLTQLYGGALLKAVVM